MQARERHRVAHDARTMSVRSITPRCLKSGTSCAIGASIMPREQVINFRHVKPVSDVWSIGATFYHMLTGDFPREFKPDRDPMEVVLNDDIISIRERKHSIPMPLARVIDRAIGNKTKERYQTAGEMLAAMKKALP